MNNRKRITKNSLMKVLLKLGKTREELSVSASKIYKKRKKCVEIVNIFK